MKILVIMGSPRKGNTYRAAERIRKIMQSYGPVEFEYLWLKDINLSACRGCFTCFTNGEENCPIKDAAPEIEQKVRDADGVIFASPVYGMNVSGLLKTFIDRFSYIFHRPRFFDKKALILTTTGALGDKEVLNYLDLVASVWGFRVAGRAGLITPPGHTPSYRKQENERKLQAAAKSFVTALNAQRSRGPRLQDVIVFRAQRAAFGRAQATSPADYRYWKEKGWLEPGVHYYVDVPVNPLYSLIGWVVERMAGRQVKKGSCGVPITAFCVHH